MKNQNIVIVSIAVLTGMLLAVWGMFAVGDNLPRGVTVFSEIAYDLHMVILWICIFTGVVVFSAMFVSIFLHRKSRNVEPARFTHNTRAEIAWTMIPILLLIAMAVPATRTLIMMETTTGADMDIKITGYQWKWHYEYLDTGVGFISSLDRESNRARQLRAGIDPSTVDNYLLNVDHPLVVPIDTKIRLLITSGDVIHSWWVPELGWKRDAIPGIINSAWISVREPGIYRGQCTELCGKDHAYMPVVVKAVPKDEFQQWLAQQPGYRSDRPPSLARVLDEG